MKKLLLIMLACTSFSICSEEKRWSSGEDGMSVAMSDNNIYAVTLTNKHISFIHLLQQCSPGRSKIVVNKQAIKIKQKFIAGFDSCQIYPATPEGGKFLLKTFINEKSVKVLGDSVTTEGFSKALKEVIEIKEAI
ncbi:hypothetical protein [Vibrio sp. SCSIO 43136]|uniref:hypothetical protein n=1 Tax=Vibrio sp. SCSIO 43136 TaxID=2819101 RepID=UPI0020765CF6|nr:hypothetical protein [Vibrio sp. SCSIO 43136]USD64204.1 hypothetical protein J4N39_08780 [Vibrio sp. SCSIO 43136]